MSRDARLRALRPAVGRLASLVAVTALVAASCGGDDESASRDASLTVFAASSLTDVFQELAPDADFRFAGSDALAARIKDGAPADVYASATTTYPAELVQSGLLESAQVFATNRLVLVVPADNPAGIESVEDLRAEGVELAIGAEGVPVGDYARTALESLGQTDVLGNVAASENDARAVLAKVVSGEVDAGFVYFTDAQAAGDDVHAIELPAQPLVEYAIGVVGLSENREAAEAFVELVLGDQGRQALEDAGFGTP